MLYVNSSAALILAFNIFIHLLVQPYERLIASFGQGDSIKVPTRPHAYTPILRIPHTVAKHG
jgi:hypothetical protein